MSEMTKAQIKREVLTHFDKELKPKGYKRTSGDGVRYYLSLGPVSVSYILIFYSLGEVEFSGVYSCHEEVEIYMQKLVDDQYPNPVFAKVPLTFLDSKNRVRCSVYEEGMSGLHEFISNSLRYINEEGAKFVEYYSYLPNILKRMDELVNEGFFWQYEGEGILYGGIDAFLKGLIISKLCNDPNFDAKLADCDERFTGEAYKRWVPYYEKLKAEILPTIEPKYNL